MNTEQIVALDFETANEQRASACAIGMVRADASGQIIDRYSTLLRPAPGFDYFSHFNVSIHGITAEDVEDAPTFEEALPELREFIGESPVIAHNMAFDYSVWNAASAAIGQPGLNSRRLCTLRIARQILRRHDRPNDLKTLAAEFAPEVDFAHHRASDDAAACLHVLFGMLPNIQVDLATLVREFSLDSSGRRPLGSRFYACRCGSLAALDTIDEVEIESWPDSDILAGAGICFTGTLDRMNRNTAKALVRKLGGTPQDGVTKKTRILVEGISDPARWRPGADGSSKTRKARALAESGQQIEAMTEETFFAMLSELEASQ
ncbi:exonuclease domain-containing protein [Rothia kristinae]|uniref:exonuclease domain-containing protein n=1 Tax=Rothia kristinae TaxID=37923 RepID=UPI003438536F